MPAYTSADSPALQFLTLAWTDSKYPSHRQKNHTMQSALTIAIESGMIFHEGDISKIYSRFRAGWWIGGNAESYYANACSSGNTSACVAWETHWERPLLAWPEKTAKPERLHIGSQITWQGLTLKVTSFNDDGQYLIACGHRRPVVPENFMEPWDLRRLASGEIVGKVIYDHENCCHRRILYSKVTPEGHLIRHFGPDLKGEDPKKEIETRRIKIPYADLLAERRKCDARVRDWKKRMEAALTVEALEIVGAECGASHREQAFRHFDLETLNAAAGKQKRKLLDALALMERTAEMVRARERHAAQMKEMLPRWLAGESVPINYFEISPHQLRIFGDSVEVTNGNSVPLSEARATLTFARSRRSKGWTRNPSKPVHCSGHELKEITADHVIIGCTTLLWTEIDRITPQLQAA